jgi:hypothetical protein
MQNSSPENSAIVSAAAAVDHAVDSFLEQHGEVPFCQSTDFAVMEPEQQKLVKRNEATYYQNVPELSAVHFCLTSAQALLEISKTLVQREVALSPIEQERHWKALAEEAKLAGRAAYRAVLILSDPTSSKSLQS